MEGVREPSGFAISRTDAYSYGVTIGWVGRVLRQAVSFRDVGAMRLPLDVAGFEAVLPLLTHGAIEGSAVPVVDRILALRLESAFAGTKSKHYVADARRLAGRSEIGIRSVDVRLRTENLLTGRFVPPPASQVDAALVTALRCIDSTLALHRGDVGKSAVIALVGSQILLTIHPFRDGNGRTARMFLAAKVLRHVGPAPTALLGMLLMQRSGAHQYHQAAWAFRAGDAEPLVALFTESERLAAERMVRGAGERLAPAALLEHCWRELRALR